MWVAKSNSFVSVAEQVCLQPVLEHRQRRSWCDTVWQAVPHLCTSNKKSTTSDRWPTAGWNVKPFSGGGPEPASVRRVGDTCEWRRQVWWCRAVQGTVRQHHYLECNSLRRAEPMETDERVSDVVAAPQVEDEPCCCILDWLETLDMNEGQVDQETVAIFQAAEDKSRSEGLNDGRQ